MCHRVRQIRPPSCFVTSSRVPSVILGRKPGREANFLAPVRAAGEISRMSVIVSASHPDFWGDFPDRKSLSCLSSVFLDTHSQQAQVKIDKLLGPARTDWLEPLAGVYAIDGATITEPLAGVYATPWCAITNERLSVVYADHGASLHIRFPV